MNFSKALWKHIKAGQSQTRFHAVSSGEGIISRIDGNSNFYFLIGGSWSHLFLHFGIHFNSVSKLIEKTVDEISEFRAYGPSFSNKLVGLFYQPVGDFCLSESDLGVYCPASSRVADIEFVLKEMEEICDNMRSISSIGEAVKYVWGEKILDVGSRFYLPASCLLAGERDIFEDSVAMFRKDPKFRCGDAYEVFAEALRAMFPNV